MRTEVTEMALAQAEGVLLLLLTLKINLWHLTLLSSFSYDGKQIIHDIIHEVEATH